MLRFSTQCVVFLLGDMDVWEFEATCFEANVSWVAPPGCSRQSYFSSAGQGFLGLAECAAVHSQLLGMKFMVHGFILPDFSQGRFCRMRTLTGGACPYDGREDAVLGMACWVCRPLPPHIYIRLCTSSCPMRGRSGVWCIYFLRYKEWLFD